jgi:sugar fermentation stimulation protein A
MNYSAPLIRATILKRYKRFLADILLPSGETVIAHVPNTGSMKTCWSEGWPALVSFHDDPKRKLKYTLEMTHNGESWIGVNTSLTNSLAIEGIKNGVVNELSGYATIKPEQKIGQSRIDILLTDDNKVDCYVEVKNVTLLGAPKLATFPDAVSERGLKHLHELMAIVASGKRAVMLYVVQRQDVERFAPAFEIDPAYSKGMRDAAASGVELLAYQCDLNQDGSSLVRSLPIELK